MKKRISALAAMLLIVCSLRGETVEAVRIEFDDQAAFDRDWVFYSFLPILNKTSFHLSERPTAVDGHILLVESKNSSGFILTMPIRVDLNKLPVMRWRWRVISNLDLPDKAEDPDDQPGVIYIGDGTRVRQHSVGYRWECNTRIGCMRTDRYRGGLSTVRSICMRNRSTPIGRWVEDERNVLEDFKAAFDRPPAEGFILCIGANSQNSKSHTRLEIDYIEFRPAAAPEK